MARPEPQHVAGPAVRVDPWFDTNAPHVPLSVQQKMRELFAACVDARIVRAPSTEPCFLTAIVRHRESEVVLRWDRERDFNRICEVAATRRRLRKEAQEREKAVPPMSLPDEAASVPFTLGSMEVVARDEEAPGPARRRQRLDDSSCNSLPPVAAASELNAEETQIVMDTQETQEF